MRELVEESLTQKLPIVGADGYAALVQQVPTIARESGLSPESVTHLLNRYGSLISDILDAIAKDSSLGEKLSSNCLIYVQKFRYAASHEGARSIEEVVAVGQESHLKHMRMV
ncbi:MAG: glycerol-3-phosphate dehydrogenase C-terminal domain-containing protein [Actinomycetota bacterium]